jgi:DNA-binding NarL/FixJ family response regulator
VTAARVYLVDDHPLVREWLANLIARQADLLVCGEAEGAAAALSGIACAHPDIVIVDISLEGRSGLDLIRELRRVHPDLPILVLSMHAEELYAARCLRAGARGYVMKREATKQVVLAIRGVLKGRVYVSQRMEGALAVELVTHPTAEQESNVPQLSDRELEVFVRLGEGLDSRRIADGLQISIKTVQTYVTRIREKLDVTTASEVMREAIRWNKRHMP